MNRPIRRVRRLGFTAGVRRGDTVLLFRRHPDRRGGVLAVRHVVERRSASYLWLRNIEP